MQQLPEKVHDTILRHTRACACSKEEHCYNFEICFNPYDLRYWFVRFIKTTITDGEPSPGEFEFLCFDLQGNPLDCQPIFQEVQDEITFYASFQTVAKYIRL